MQLRSEVAVLCLVKVGARAQPFNPGLLRVIKRTSSEPQAPEDSFETSDFHTAFPDFWGSLKVARSALVRAKGGQLRRRLTSHLFTSNFIPFIPVRQFLTVLQMAFNIKDFLLFKVESGVQYFKNVFKITVLRVKH